MKFLPAFEKRCSYRQVAKHVCSAQTNVTGWKNRLRSITLVLHGWLRCSCTPSWSSSCDFMPPTLTSWSFLMGGNRRQNQNANAVQVRHAIDLVLWKSWGLYFRNMCEFLFMYGTTKLPSFRSTCYVPRRNWWVRRITLLSHLCKG